MSTSSNKIAKIKAEAYDLVKDETGKTIYWKNQ